MERGRERETAWKRETAWRERDSMEKRDSMERGRETQIETALREDKRGREIKNQ